MKRATRAAGILGALAMAGCMAGSIDTGAGGGSDFNMKGPYDVVIQPVRHQGTSGEAESAMSSLPGAPNAIYLNRDGRTYTAGQDDSVHGASSVVSGQGLSSATIPPLAWSDANWQSFVGCLADEYGRFNVKVTDQRPASGTYIEAAIGGTGAEVGFGGSVGGVAPVNTYGCTPIATAVVFIFAGNSWASDPQTACEIAAQEIGHAIVPLDHEYLAADPMTYLNYNGHKVFQDQSAQCGEYQTRQCFCNRATQNSVALLTSTLGKASSNPPPPPPPPANNKPPVVAITSPADGTTLAGNSTISVSVNATDPDDAVASVTLYWAYTGRTLACDSSVSGVNCTHSGSTWTWQINVGTGARQFYATATDSAGASTQSATSHLTLSNGSPPPPPPAVDTPPTVSVTGPAVGTVLHPGGALVVTATASDDKIVAQVVVSWTNSAGTTTFAMQDQGGGNYVLSTTMSTSAAPGPRSFTVTATDDAGLTTTSGKVALTVQ